jgi:hypothetical protein
MEEKKVLLEMDNPSSGMDWTPELPRLQLIHQTRMS